MGTLPHPPASLSQLSPQNLQTRPGSGTTHRPESPGSPFTLCQFYPGASGLTSDHRPVHLPGPQHPSVPFLSPRVLGLGPRGRSIAVVPCSQRWHSGPSRERAVRLSVGQAGRKCSRKAAPISFSLMTSHYSSLNVLVPHNPFPAVCPFQMFVHYCHTAFSLGPNLGTFHSISWPSLSSHICPRA